MRIVFMGTPDFAAGILKAVLDAGYEVVGAVTQPDRPKGRKREPVPCPVKELALSRGIEVQTPVRVRRPEELAKIRALAPDLILVAAFGQILPKELLELPRFGCLNVHASLLPAYRGAAPIQHAILDGCEKTGVSIMQMDEGLDTGDILAVREIPIEPDETGGSLFDKLAALGAELLLETLPKVGTGELLPVPQPKESTTAYASMLKKEDGRINWHEAADAIARKVRAFSPWPGAYTEIDGKNLRIWKAEAVLEAAFDETFRQMKPACFRVLPEGRLLVRAGEGYLLVLELQLEGKRQMKTEDFLRGYRVRKMWLGTENEYGIPANNAESGSE